MPRDCPDGGATLPLWGTNQTQSCSDTGKGRGSRWKHLPVLGLSLLHQQDLCHPPAGRWLQEEFPAPGKWAAFPQPFL